MKTYNVPLESFISKGKVSLKVTNGELHMITLEEGLSKKHQNYAYNGETKRSCGGAMKFNWIPSEFEDVRKVISAVSEVVKAANNNM